MPYLAGGGYHRQAVYDQGHHNHEAERSRGSAFNAERYLIA